MEGQVAAITVQAPGQFTENVVDLLEEALKCYHRVSFTFFLTVECYFRLARYCIDCNRALDASDVMARLIAAAKDSCSALDQVREYTAAAC